MYIILGASGHIGSKLATNLLEAGEAVTVITHDKNKKNSWEQKGVSAVVADVHDDEALHEVFLRGKRLFVLNPPAAISSDTVKEEKFTVAAILSALRETRLEKIVAESTYGAQAGEALGDLGVLYDMEQGLREIGIPHNVIRAAYYMSNWDASFASAQKDGVVRTLYPADFRMPMVAPRDIALLASQLITGPVTDTGIHYIQGPRMYSANDVAGALGEVLRKVIKVQSTPPEHWIATLEEQGFSTKAAKSMAAMTDIALRQAYEMPVDPNRGSTSLHDYFSQLV